MCIPFLYTNNNSIGQTCRPKLLEILNDPSKVALLQVELAAVIDLGETTYNLEGDGPLAFECYGIIKRVAAVIHTGHYPNVQAIARKLSPGNIVNQQHIGFLMQWLA